MLAKVLRGIESKCQTAWGALTMPPLANRPARFSMRLPREIVNGNHVTVGDGVTIGPNSIIEAVTARPGQSFTPEIQIGDRVEVTGRFQLHAAGRVEIGDDVLIASNVFICDVLHGYESATIPYKGQPLTAPKPIVIGRGSWIGQNVVVMPGVNIGEYCIIGANSVVTRSIPDRHIAVGSPARPIKRWDDATNAWVAVTAS